MISIVIGVYNGENYLNACIDSVLNQTYEDIQIILVDDKSQDNSMAISQKYMREYPEKIKLIAHEENKGTAAALNTGILASDGEYVMIMGDDDWLDPDLCENIYDVTSQKEADIVFTGKKGWIGGQSILYKPYPREYLGIMTVEKKRKTLVHLANDSGFVIVGAYRRSFLMENNLLFQQMVPEDIPVTPLCVVCASNIEMVDNSYYNYRIHDNSVTHKKNSDFYLNIYKAGLLMRQNFIDRKIYGIYREEVDFAFILSTYYVTIYNALARYDERPIELMIKVRDIIRELAPNWKENVYIHLCWVQWKYELLKLNDESPQRLAERFPDCDEFIKKARNGELEKEFSGGGMKVLDFLIYLGINGNSLRTL